MAKVLDIDRTTYGKYETGDSSPHYEKLVELADFFGVSVDYLVGKTDSKTPITGPTLDDDANEFLEQLHKRPEMKMLFSVSKNATKKDIEKMVKIFEALREDNE